MQERFFIDEIAAEDEILQLDLRNIENNQLDYKVFG